MTLVTLLAPLADSKKTRPSECAVEKGKVGTAGKGVTRVTRVTMPDRQGARLFGFEQGADSETRINHTARGRARSTSDRTAAADASGPQRAAMAGQ